MILREGVAPLGVAAALAVWASWHGAWLLAAPAWVVAAWLALIFADRRPSVPGDALGVLAPVGGAVQCADSVEDPWLQRRARRVRIAIPFPGITVVRAPAESKVCGYWVSPVPFDAGVSARAGARGGSPNCYAVGLKTDEGDELVFALSSVRSISRFRLDRSPGERIRPGDRIGFIYFGAYVDVLAAANTRITAAAGEVVRGGESVLGSFVHD